MSRLLMLLGSVILLGTTASADTFGGWHYTAPPGYAVEVNDDHVALTKVRGSTFCSIAVFEARALDGPVRAARAFEWHNIVTHQFKASVKRRTTMQTKQGVNVAGTTAALVDGEGNKYAAVHYAVMPPGMIGSVLLTSSTAASLKACEPIATSVVGTLSIDWSSPRFTDPEARVETPEGRWAVVGATRREYTFASDGSYRFHSETADADRDRVIDEMGKYTLVGNRLTLTPRVATSAVVHAGIAKPVTRLPLEKTTYTWGKRYSPDTNTWQLVLAPNKATARDGKLPANDAAYRYSDRVKPEWKFAPQPGV
jgi:hypothetical protein